ncbi:MAG: hypothetical protein CTY19_07385 [Methylomonas sp.]|nr:MAG: hypothetical protein CTY19_07385 [Methylomonas sp.]
MSCKCSDLTWRVLKEPVQNGTPNPVKLNRRVGLAIRMQMAWSSPSGQVGAGGLRPVFWLPTHPARVDDLT